MEADRELKDLPVDDVIARVGVAQAIGIKHVASLLFTYRCTIACSHCLFNCGPRQRDLHVSQKDGIQFMRQLRETDRVVHIAGGEAMMYYPALLSICQAAGAEGKAPHFFETNASWCKDEETTRTRYEALRDVGVLGVLISADPYHQAFVPPERRERAYRWAVAIFGQKNVAGADLKLEELQELRRIGRDHEAMAAHARRHPPRLVGRAGQVLSPFMPDRPLTSLVEDVLWHGHFPGEGCGSELHPKEMWEIHIDPYGNVQTCCGIILGNARERPLQEQIELGFPLKDPVLAGIAERGPFLLLELAKVRGFEPRLAYPQKCGLCWEVRKFLRPHFPHVFGPAEIYESPIPLRPPMALPSNGSA